MRSARWYQYQAALLRFAVMCRSSFPLVSFVGRRLVLAKTYFALLSRSLSPPQTTACALINPCRLSCPLLLSSLSFSFSVFHIVAHRCDSRTFSATRRNSFTHAILHHLFSLFLSLCLFIKVSPALVLRLPEAGQPSSLPPRNPAEQQYSPPGLPV